MSSETSDGACEIGAGRLSIADVVRVARQAKQTVFTDAKALVRVQASAAWVAQTIDGIEHARDAGAAAKAYYGVNTGFGAQAGKSALDSRYLAELLGRNLIASHAVGVGPFFDEEVVRAVLLLRAQSLAQGHSGVRPIVIETLVRMLNAGVYPALPEQGSLGASGDLAPLAHLALAMTSAPTPGDGSDDVGLDRTDGEAFVPVEDGQADGPLHLTQDHTTGAQRLWRRVSGAQAMAAIGGKLALRPKEALALLNGATVSAAIAALVVADAQNLLDHAELALAMTLEGCRGFRDPFFPQLHAARGHENAGRVAARVLAFVEGSELLDPGDLGVDPARVPPQDPYSVRCAPQVLGTVADTLELACRWVEMDINAATDNPLIFLDLERDYKAVSGGNFHGEPIALGMDFLAIALTEIASLSERRMFMLNDLRPGKPDGLPGFLIAEPARTAGLNAGLMMLQATAAALVADCKVLAHPDSVDSIPSSGNQEDHVSMSLNAALHARQVGQNVAQVLAMELICAAQAIWLQTAKPGSENLRPGRGVAAACGILRWAGIEPLTRDRVLQPDIRRAASLLRSGELIRAARAPS